MVEVATSRDRIPIAYQVAGTGDPAIVFVHGWSCDRTYWRHQVAAFEATHRVVAIDLAGHGDSGAGRASWTVPSFGADVAAVVDVLNLQDIVLVGHSSGGDVIVEAALMLGDRVRAAVWVDTYHRLTVPETPQAVEAFVEPFRRDFVGRTRSLVSGMFPPTTSPELIEVIATDMSSAPPEVAIDALRHAFANEGPVMAALPRLGLPVVAINPDYQPTNLESLRRYGVETVIASGVGHFLMLEDAPQFNRLLADVIGRTPPRGPRMR